MPSRRIVARVALCIAVAMWLPIASGRLHAQTPANLFDSAIPFYGGRLVGFDQQGVLRTAGGVVQPTAPASIFVTIKLEIIEPFAYVRGRFKEIAILDQRGGVYRYRGWLTGDGWVQIDDPNDFGGDIPMIEAGRYPATVDIHFEVPVDAPGLVLSYDGETRALSW